MKVIRPTLITDDILTSSSVAEPESGYPAYSAVTSYADKAHVYVADTHRRYEAIGAVAAGLYPPLNPTKWLDLGATNRWAMFDQAKGSLTTALGEIEVVLSPGRVDSLTLLDLTAQQVTVSVTVGGVEVYSRTQATAAGGINIDNWYDWFFAQIGIRTRLAFDDLPTYRNGIVTVLIEGASPSVPVACGTLLIGRAFDIGTTLSGVDIGIDDYSKKVRDDYGVVTFVPRAYSDSISCQVAIESSRADGIKATFAELRATPTVWIVETDLDAGILYGIFKSFRINLAMLTGISNCSIDLEGLV